MTSPLHLVALGANLDSPAGGPRDTLDAAVVAFADRGLDVVARSRWFRTPAYPPGSGPEFVNGAVVLRSGLGPEAVLAELHAVEAALGRDRRRRWAPRACDLDLLASGDRVLPDAATVRAWMDLAGDDRLAVPLGLLLPHPRLHERGFVLAPLADVAPDWRHPLTGMSVAAMLAALPPEALDGVAPL